LTTAEALKEGDLQRLGELINRESLRDDYEVSCRELNIMVELARQQAGVAAPA
jgi:galactokinase